MFDKNSNVPRVLVVIVTYNGAEWIQKCIESIYESNYEHFKIFVVDNASSDNTIEILNTFPDINLHKSSVNLGFGKANNQGMKYALEKKYDYVFLLNQDTWIEKDTISTLVKCSEKNQDYGIISPMHYYSDEKSLEYNFSVQLSPWFCKKILSDHICLTQDNIQDIYELNFVNAAAWLLPQRTLRTIGGFDPIFFHYGEDNNYCHRVKYHQLKIGINPFSKIFHDCADANNKTLQTTKEKIRKFALEHKVNFANINLDTSNRVYYGLLVKKILLGLIDITLLKFEKGTLKIKEAGKIKIAKKEIFNSRRNNVLKRSNYL